jgi:hypothetical protein
MKRYPVISALRCNLWLHALFFLLDKFCCNNGSRSAARLCSGGDRLPHPLSRGSGALSAPSTFSPTNSFPPFPSNEQIGESISVRKSVIIKPDLVARAEPMTCAADHNGFGAVEAGLSGRLQTAARPCVLGQRGPRRGPAGRRRRHQELLQPRWPLCVAHR